MFLKGDYHTHTVYSDGVSTIEENVRVAKEKGLSQIAITDHGFSHTAYGIKRHQVKEQKKEIERVAKLYNFTVLHGIEANLLSLEGDIDLTKDEQNYFDVIVLGYHKTYKPTSIKNFFNFFVPNTLNPFKRSKKRVAKNTQSYINAIRKNKIDILAHLNYGGCKVNCVEIAKVAKEHDVYIELNGKRILFSDDEILQMQKTGVKFIINSDAHISKNIGKNNKAFNLIEKLNIPHSQVVNLVKLPKFKNTKKV